jgi:HPt (histidine-containing phosphotransfer) domain-containing protein
VDDFKQKFLGRFTALARERISLGMNVAASTECDEALHLARELHSLAGEAGLLGLPHLLVSARTAEEAATKLNASRDPSEREALKAALSELGQAIERIASEASPG